MLTPNTCRIGLILGIPWKSSARISEKAIGEAALYRVQRSKDDAAAQIGAFKTLRLAKDMADVNPGYKVFDYSGTLVYA